MRQRLVHQLWYDPNDANLPPLAQASARSIMERSDCTLWLWSYRSTSQRAAHEKDANEILEEATFQKYITAGHKIMHIVDLFRFIALERHGGYWMDSDTICLRALPDVKRIFQTIPRRLSGVRVRKQPFFADPRLGDPANSIFRVPKNDPLMRYMIAYTVTALTKSGPIQDTRIVYEWGRKVAEMYPDHLSPPILFCPLPENTLPQKESWSKFGWTVPSLFEIKTHSIALDFYGSAKRKFPTKWLKILKVIDPNLSDMTTNCKEPI